MKKLLGIVVLGLLWCNSAIANLIDLDKCFHPSKPDMSWTMENYEMENTEMKYSEMENSEMKNTEIAKQNV